MNCSMSDMPRQCLFLHDRSSIIRHSPREALPWHQIDMLDLDAIRRRLVSALKEKGYALTGKDIQSAGIGQTTLRNFMDGSSRSMTLETLAKLDNELGIDAGWLLFGPAEAQTTEIDADALSGMVELALDELQPGMTFAEIRPAVAANLHEQLRRALSVGVAADRADGGSARDTASQPRAPTKRSAQAE